MTSSADWISLFRRVFLFSSFTGSQLNLLAKKMSLVSYPKGAVLFHENDPGDSIYIIVSGSIRITSRTTNAKGEPKETTIGYLNRGDALGEMSLLAGEQALIAISESGG
jgi:CRP-like cAMP-binding protein